jgi:hypothetical protein
MEARRRALIVANDRYDNEGLRRLHSPAADADALDRVLGDPRIGGFEVQIVRNEPAHVIGTQIEDLFSDSRPDDVLLLHFSCHGLKSESGELFFAASGTRPDRLGSTAVSADFVQRCMRTSRSRSIVLLLDCCYGGAFSQGVAVRSTGGVSITGSFPAGRLGGGRGRAVITASSSMEYAFEGDRLAEDAGLAPSVFTAALVEGLASGDADRDEDGWVSLNELYDYVFDRVRERNPHQTPSRDVEMQGELYIARSTRRRVRPQQIPADLRAAMSDGNMFSRIGAVTELRARLGSDNLPLAAGAAEALREIAATDIQYVADAATAALADVRVRVSEPQLRFEAVAGTEAAGLVRLLGPPLGRACTAQASDDRVRVTEMADGFAVSADTRSVGTYRADVLVKGPYGEVTVPVEVVVTPVPVPVPAARPVVAAPESPPERVGRPWDSWELAAAGIVVAALGLVVLGIENEQAQARAVIVLLAAYGIHWLVSAALPGVQRPVRRVVAALIGVLTIGSVVWLAGLSLHYLEYWALNRTPLYGFLVVAGLLECGAVLAAGPRPTRTAEWVSAGWGLAVGLIVVVVIASQIPGSLGVPFGLHGIGVGVIWLVGSRFWESVVSRAGLSPAVGDRPPAAPPSTTPRPPTTGAGRPTG